MKIQVIGNTVADLIMRLPSRFLRRSLQEESVTLPFGAKIVADNHTFEIGGSGANVAVGLKRLGVEVSLRTTVGDDAIGRDLTERLNLAGVGLEVTTAESASALSVVLSVGNERTIVSGHLDDLSFLELPFPDKGWLHLSPLPFSNDDFYRRLVEHRIKTSQKVSLNPSMVTLEERGRSFLSLLKTTEIIFLNIEEATRLTRLPTRSLPEELIKAVHLLGPKVVCITAGAKGAYVSSGEVKIYAAALCDDVCRVDATGAGDAFTSGFLAGYLTAEQDSTIKEILERSTKFAILNSAAVVAQIGGQQGLQTQTQIDHDLQAVKLRVL